MSDAWEQLKNKFIYDLHALGSQIVRLAETMTPIEKLMIISLVRLAQNVGKFNCTVYYQYPIGKYKADFLFDYHPVGEHHRHKKIVIECDGHDFHEKTKQQASHDKSRDRFMTTSGYVVLRYTGSDIVRDYLIAWNDIIAMIYPSDKEGAESG